MLERGVEKDERLAVTSLGEMHLLPIDVNKPMLHALQRRHVHDYFTSSRSRSPTSRSSASGWRRESSELTS